MAEAFLRLWVPGMGRPGGRDRRGVAGKARLVGHELEGESWLCDLQKLPILGTLASPHAEQGCWCWVRT